MQPLSSKNTNDGGVPSRAMKPARLAGLGEVQRALGVRFRRIELLDQALSHSSFVNELPDEKLQHNE